MEIRWLYLYFVDGNLSTMILFFCWIMLIFLGKHNDPPNANRPHKNGMQTTNPIKTY